MNEKELEIVSADKLIHKDEVSSLKDHELLDIESLISYGGVSVIEVETGPRMLWSKDKTEVTINTALFQNKQQAHLVAIRQIAQRLGLNQAIRNDANELLEFSKKDPVIGANILKWQGLIKIRETSDDSLDKTAESFKNQTLVQEFQFAIDSYLLTGKYPRKLSSQVKNAIGRIPTNKVGVSAVDLIASGRYLSFDRKNFKKYIKPLFDELADIDKKSEKSEQSEYRPAQTEDLAKDKEALSESDITVRTTPFYGGYYREQACYYDSGSRQIVKESGIKRTWFIDEPPDDELVWKTKRTYEGVFEPGSETLIKLPYNALPLNLTLTPADKFVFMKDNLGTIYLEPKEGHNFTEKIIFSFDFLIVENGSNILNVFPIDNSEAFTVAGGDLDPETQVFMDKISDQSWMSDVQKAKEVARYLRKKLRYPNDDEEISKIDSIYNGLPSEELWKKMSEVGVVHCYWANIFRDELCKRLGIASRIVTGPYVTNKDPRFDFTVVEARGVDKHAWGEIWDPAKEQWTHRGMDATPAKENDDDSDEDSDSEETESLDGDFGDPAEEEVPELSEEEVQQLYEELAEEDEKDTPDPTATPEEIAAEQFEKEKKVSYEEWSKLRDWIDGINRMPIEPDQSIKGRKSTLYQEWRYLFDLLYERRKIPHRVYSGPVRQSEGDLLADPVAAYIDVHAQVDDPTGYEKIHQKQKERIEISTFEDDFILDISGSMRGLPEEEQKRMVLSSLYNIKSLNERMTHSKNRSKMTTSLAVRSRVALFGNWTEVVQESDSVITEKSLVELEAVLRADETSRGLAVSLTQYQESLTPETLQAIKAGKHKKVLTIVSDGDVTDKGKCTRVIKELRASGIIVQGIGFGSDAQDIRVICHDPTDSDAAVVIEDVTQATLVRHRLLMKHLSKL